MHHVDYFSCLLGFVKVVDYGLKHNRCSFRELGFRDLGIFLFFSFLWFFIFFCKIRVIVSRSPGFQGVPRFLGFKV